MNELAWAVLRVSLHKAIQKWCNSVADTDEVAGFVGLWTDDILVHMTDAALHTLRVSADKEQWLREQGYVKD